VTLTFFLEEKATSSSPIRLRRRKKIYFTDFLLAVDLIDRNFYLSEEKCLASPREQDYSPYKNQVSVLSFS